VLLRSRKPAFGFEEVLVAQGHVFRGEVGVRGGEQELAVEAFLSLDLGPVDDEPAVGELADG